MYGNLVEAGLEPSTFRLREKWLTPELWGMSEFQHLCVRVNKIPKFFFFFLRQRINNTLNEHDSSDIYIFLFYFLLKCCTFLKIGDLDVDTGDLVFRNWGNVNKPSVNVEYLIIISCFLSLTPWVLNRANKPSKYSWYFNNFRFWLPCHCKLGLFQYRGNQLKIWIINVMRDRF